MPKYIDADALFDRLLKTKDGLQEAAARTDDRQEAWMAEGMEAFLSDLNHFPTADVAPVVHGRWVNKNDTPHCTVCDYIPAFDVALDDIYYSPFCPNCRAKMDMED